MGKVVERDEYGNPIRFTGTHTDVTSLKEAEIALQQKKEELQKSYEELEKRNAIILNIAKHDGLTNIFNRRAFDQHLAKEWERWKRNHINFALLMIDIDYFKAFNDTYGHQVGDECLKSVAQSLEKVAARKNDYIARYGGEEFVVLLSDNIHLHEAIRLAKKLKDTIENLHIQHSNSKVSNFVTLSIGVAISDQISENDMMRKN